MNSNHHQEGPDDLLNVQQVAALLGAVGKPLSGVRVRQMIAEGVLPATRATGNPKGNITVRRKYVMAHIEANTHGAGELSHPAAA